MTKAQISTIGIFTLLFAILYFGFSTKPSDHKLIEKSRALKMSTTDVSILKREAVQQLNNVQQGRIDLLNAQLNNATDSLDRIKFLKDLSGAWYEFGFSSIAGTYAEEIAEQEGTDVAWGIAATTYAIGIGKAISEKDSKYCKERAMAAFDMAISLEEGDAVVHKLNKAVTLADHPDEDNPMKGILQLLDLNKQHPDNVPVLNQLAKLGMRTNQLDKALDRLTRALNLDSENVLSNCLMADLLSKRNESAKAEEYINKCNSLK